MEENDPGFTLAHSEPHPCNIIPGRVQREQFMHPEGALSLEFNAAAYAEGYARFVKTFRRDDCVDCDACRPCRIPVQDFDLSHSQKLVMAKNADISYRIGGAVDAREHYKLFSAYFNARHATRSALATVVAMNDFSAVQKILNAYGVVEFRDANRKLVGAALVDWLADGLAVNHSYYDVADSKTRSLGTYMLLVLSEVTRRQGMDHLYLGAVTREPSALQYKSRFRPLEVMKRDGTWERFAAPSPGPS